MALVSLYPRTISGETLREAVAPGEDMVSESMLLELSPVRGATGTGISQQVEDLARHEYAVPIAAGRFVEVP